MPDLKITTSSSHESLQTLELHASMHEAWNITYYLDGFEKERARKERKKKKEKNPRLDTCVTRFISEVDQKTDTICHFKGVLHPRLVFGQFLHFSQKLQHIGNK